ncbi:C-type lectin domain family 6 member A [Tenrec ecaudatus]|uniref:C-type lectin domain family 6 member A n=1 Tax=Tenrec ecaudatus TaxID=94439 RepID=UPI003F59A4B9
MQEGQSQDRGKGVWWSQMRCWSVAAISITLLSICFIVSCVVTYNFTYGKNDQKLSQLHTYHSSLTCSSEGTRVTVWGCCPSTWKPFDSSCYFISTKKENWAKHEQNCVGMGGHLVVINTEAEQNFIIHHLNESFPYFLGLTDPQGKNKWQWIDQTPYKENVRFWHDREPNLSAEQCVSIVFWAPGKWGWNDVLCHLKMNSICEMKKIYI